MQKIPDKLKLEIINDLEERKLFFRKFWAVSDIYWSDKVKTAAVELVNDKIQFLFNREFWDTLNPMARLFVICHEQLHLLNNHFLRLRFSEGNAKLKNIAADVAINELLIRNYPFEKEMIPDYKNYCWLDTVFGDFDIAVSDNETAEYYYSLLVAKQEQEQKKVNDALEQMAKDGTLTDAIKEAMQNGIDNMYDDNQTLDDHTYSIDSQNSLSNEVKEAIEDALESFEDSNPDSNEVDKASKRIAYRKAKRAGNVVGNKSFSHDIPIRKRRHWRKLYKKICKSVHAATMQGHWAFTDDRMALLKTGVDLPGDYILDELRKTKVVVYLDVSGSCVDDTKFFLRNAMSLPKELFEVRYFTFDTVINPISSKPPFNFDGGGGTCFDCIRNHVENELDYYDAVFIFTDGEAEQVTVKAPKKWHWFISPSGTHNNISPKSHSFDLTDYGWTEAMEKERKAS